MASGRQASALATASPTGFAGQAFVPLIDEDPSTGLILVLFGQQTCCVNA